MNRRPLDMSPKAPNGSRRAPPLPYWAALLERFYQPTGLSVPALRELKAEEVPPPYQSLLVHSWDMTPTLTRFYGQTLGLNVLGREYLHDSYKREVILWTAKDHRPVEYGVIRIHLDRLPPNARRLVLEEERPLGDILQGEAIPHLSWPQAFFRLKADAHTGAALGLRGTGVLFGRHNVLLDASRRLLADVIEVLAPAGAREPSRTWGRLQPGGALANGSSRAVNGAKLKRARLTKVGS